MKPKAAFAITTPRPLGKTPRLSDTIRRAMRDNPDLPRAFIAASLRSMAAPRSQAVAFLPSTSRSGSATTAPSGWPDRDAA